MTSEEAQEEKYVFKGRFGAPAQTAAREQATREELDDFVKRVLGIPQDVRITPV